MEEKDREIYLNKCLKEGKILQKPAAAHCDDPQVLSLFICLNVQLQNVKLWSARQILYERQHGPIYKRMGDVVSLAGTCQLEGEPVWGRCGGR